jgi:hypothetical protein
MAFALFPADAGGSSGAQRSQKSSAAVGSWVAAGAHLAKRGKNLNLGTAPPHQVGLSSKLPGAGEKNNFPGWFRILRNRPRGLQEKNQPFWVASPALVSDEVGATAVKPDAWKPNKSFLRSARYVRETDPWKPLQTKGFRKFHF